MRRWPLWSGVVAVVIVMAAGGWLLARESVRADDTARLTAELQRVIGRQHLQIEYLCETTTVFDVLVVQEQAFLRALLKSAQLGKNERELLRERDAALQSAHFELSNQRACTGFR